MSEARMLRRPEVETKTGLSKATLYRLMKEGKFPRPMQLSERAVRWPSSEIDDWLSKRPRTTPTTEDETH